MTLILKPKFTNSTYFFKKMSIKKQHISSKKQVIFFFTVAFCAMIHIIYLKRYCLLTLLLFFVFPSLFS